MNTRITSRIENALWGAFIGNAPDQRMHYHHHGLQAGESTLGAKLVRVLM